MKRFLSLLLFVVIAAVAAYGLSPGFRRLADAALPDAVGSRLTAALAAGHLLSGGNAGTKRDDGASDAAKAGSGGGKRRAAVAVAASVATRRDMPILKYAIGFIESPAVVSVNSRVTSQVVTQHVTDGQTVKAGDLLFTLDDRALKAQLAKDQATLAKDEAQQASAEASLERARSLFAQQTTSKQALDQAVADAKIAAANVAADKATIQADDLQISYTRITAPISGRLGAVQVHPGNLVNAGVGNGATPLVTITQISPIRVSFAVPTDELPTLRKAIAAGTPPVVRIYSPGDYGTGGDKPIATGKLDFIDSSVDTASGSVVVKASIANEDSALWPGQYVNVVVQAGILRDLTIVPTVAVQQGQSGPFVFVVRDDGTVAIRPVAIAASEGETTGLASGLKPGERVVTEGQIRLKNGTPVSVKETDAKAGEAVVGPDGTGPSSDAARRRS